MRVSTQDQCLDRQFDGMRGICDELRVEKLSAVAAKRPVLEGLLADLREGDTLVVWDLDRAFRSTRDALDHAEALLERRVHFRVITYNIDTAHEDGMLVYTLLAAINQHERQRLARRTREGVEAARQRGKRIGRPPKLSREEVLAAKRRLDAKEASISKLARECGVHPWTLTRSIRRLNNSVQ